MEHVVEWKAENEIQQSQPLSSFSNLTHLQIWKCRGLKYLLPASVGKCLMQLERLVIADCGALEVVIRKERVIDDGMIINFPNLKYLNLFSLPSLTTFYGENRDDNAASSGPAGSDCLFDGKVSFPTLVELYLNVDIEVGKFGSTPDIKWLEVRCDHKVQLPSKWELQILNIEVLILKNCWWNENVLIGRAENLIGFRNNTEAFSKLKKLSIESCDDMEHLLEIPQSQPLTSFSILTSLEIKSCSGLKYLFSASVAKCLVQLRKLKIESCPALEVVVRNESLIEEVILEFPKLKELDLQSLPSLTRFYQGKNRGRSSNSSTIMENAAISPHAFVFPELTKLRLNVPNLKCFYFNESMEERQPYLPTKVSFPRLVLLELDVKGTLLDGIEIGKNNSASEVTKFIVKCDNIVQLPSKWKLQFPNTQELSLSIQSCEGMEHLACIPRSEINQSRPLTSFSKLTSLDINKCSGLKYLFTASVAKCLVDLKRLVIENCPTLEVVIRNQSTVDGVIINFPKLELLTLWNLDSFQRFYGEDRGRSSSSTIIIENADISPDASESPFDGMASFPNVEILKFNVKSLPNCFSNMEALTNLKRLFIGSCEDREPLACIPQYEIQQSQPLTPFSELNRLYIHKCSGLKYLFGVSVAKCLVQLQELYINDCPALEVVIQNESAINGMSIEFPKLTDLALINLQSLRRFYREKSGKSSSSTTLMENADISSDSSESLFNAMVAFPVLKQLFIVNLKTSDIWKKNCYKDNSFSRLKLLEIAECHNLDFAIPLPMLPKFHNLEDLYILKCDSMSEIIRKEENEDELVFLELAGLYLKDLPNFKSFCLYEFGHRFHLANKVFLPKLLELEFYYCNTITLDEIELSKGDSTSELKKLDVRCHNEHQLPSKWQLQLPNIEELKLKNCTWHGSSGEHDVQQLLINPPSFQSLKVVEVRNCGLSALFSCSVFTNLHQLKKLKVKHCPLLEEVVRGDDNIVGACENPISLKKLEYIELKHLPKLKSFSRSASYAFNLPALKSIVLCKCPQMENFTFREISTPSMPDFNSQIEKYLSNPEEGNEEDTSDSESDYYQSYDESDMGEWFDNDSDSDSDV